MGDYYTNRADDMYFSALYDEEEIFPISDEKYAGELQLQEILISATMSFSLPSQPATNPPPKKRRSLIAPTACCSSSQTFCKICMEAAPLSDMFENNNCPHVFCRACLSQHIETKLQENIAVIKCPEVQCKAVLEPEICRDIIPIGVFEKWESALCESMVLDAKKFYCPFKDCSVLLVDDAEEKVVQAECPSCRRMFCAQCASLSSAIDVEENGVYVNQIVEADLRFGDAFCRLDFLTENERAAC
ncbi:hypothetical protein J5N97_009248 [Dioscorea zingiberensis]|uniref:RBR-type E3 ubiquitin transferase n=1 Tax=Dioscorea zingiberensis TaxID=325984 RepID=A0A9D5CYY5_9LILI|nr:hypothetical protein J5N97_009248 [Dioscorea zingiberensis]